MEPTRGALSVELGRVLLNESRAADALPHLVRAARLRPEDPEPWCGIADAHYDLGNLRAAAEAARRRARLEPDSEAALLSLVDILCRADRFAEAVHAARWLMRRHPRTQRNAVFLSTFGISLAGLKHYDLAVKAHRSALDLDPSLAASWHNLGYIFGERGRWKQAIPFYREAALTKPEWPRAWRDLGRALCHCRRPGEAIAACRRALELAPRSAESRRVLRDALDLQANGPASPVDSVPCGTSIAPQGVSNGRQ
jgi:tetratricopeptide (TPR) repeat protein